MADDWRPRRVDVGRVNDRYFTFSAGAGLDASVVEIVDAHPRLKARMGEWYYTWAAVKTFNRRYLVHPLRLRAQIGAETVDGVTAIVQNAHPYTYFGDRAVRMAEGASLRQRRPGRHRPAPGQPPRRAVDRLAGAVGPRRTWSATGTSTATAGSARCASPASTTAPCPCRSTATTSATYRRPCSPACPEGILVVS